MIIVRKQNEPVRKLRCNMHDLSRFDVFLQFDTTLIDILRVFFYFKKATLLHLKRYPAMAFQP